MSRTTLFLRKHFQRTLPAIRICSLHLRCGSAALPSPHKSQQSREAEDAHCHSPFGLGVFDGVGGWARRGIDPRVYAQSLMLNTRDAINNGILSPKEALHHAWKGSQGKTGSATALVCCIENDKLSVVSIGDCQMMHIRDSEVSWRSVPRQHAFNRPLQLGSHSQDTPEHGDEKRLDARAGDIVVVGSDGLFDNLDDDAILKALFGLQPKLGTNARLESWKHDVSHDLSQNDVKDGSFTTRVGYRQMRAKYKGVLVGRAPTCDVVIPNPKISKHHCIIQFSSDGPSESNGVRIIDLSSNGTFCNGSRLSKGAEVLLEQNDVISLSFADPKQAVQEGLLAFTCTSDSVSDSVEGTNIAVENIKDPKEAAERLADAALKVSLNPEAETPFAQAALAALGPAQTSGKGGKPDDITVVVAQISPNRSGDLLPASYFSDRKIVNYDPGLSSSTNPEDLF